MGAWCATVCQFTQEPRPWDGGGDGQRRRIGDLFTERGPEEDDVLFCIIIAWLSESFNAGTFAVATAFVYPTLMFPFVDRHLGLLCSVAVFGLAFAVRPLGRTMFGAVKRDLGRTVELVAATLLLVASTAAFVFLPGYDQFGSASVVLLVMFRIAQGLAQGGAWDGFGLVVTLNDTGRFRAWSGRSVWLGGALGLALAMGLLGDMALHTSTAEFIDWGWRYPMLVAVGIDLVVLAARLRVTVMR